MVLPTPAEFVKEVNILKDNIMSGKSLARVFDMTVNEFTAKGLVVAEVTFWFHIGEMIGRRSIIGYNPKVERNLLPTSKGILYKLYMNINESLKVK